MCDFDRNLHYYNQNANYTKGIFCIFRETNLKGILMIDECKEIPELQAVSDIKRLFCSTLIAISILYAQIKILSTHIVI